MSLRARSRLASRLGERKRWRRYAVAAAQAVEMNRNEWCGVRPLVLTGQLLPAQPCSRGALWAGFSSA
jgi:hypothetical protein